MYVRLSLFWTKNVGGIWRKSGVGNLTIAQKLRLDPNRNAGFNLRG